MELQQNLLNLRILRAQLKASNADALIRIRDNINVLIQEHQEEEEFERLRVEEQKEDMQKAKNQIEQMGLTLEEVAKYFNVTSTTEPEKKTRVSARKGIKMAPKYQYEDPEDPSIMRYWTGQGRIPSKMLKRMEIDHRPDKEFYLINPE